MDIKMVLYIHISHFMSLAYTRLYYFNYCWIQACPPSGLKDRQTEKQRENLKSLPLTPESD